MFLSIENLEALLGFPLPDEARAVSATLDLSYRELSPAERDAAIKRSVEVLLAPKKPSGPDYREIWEAGWKQNLDEFSVSGDENSLVPKFVKNNQPIRLRGELIMPLGERFESDFVVVLREAFFRRYFQGYSSIAEFGCGTGTNLIHLQRIFPEASLVGADWASSSIDLLDKVNQRFGFSIEGVEFDLFHPEEQALGQLTKAQAAFTIGTMEQLGENFEPFLQFLLDSDINRVIHFETAYELYDPDNLWDFFAMSYIEKRNWLRGYFSALRELEMAGTIRILYQARTFGSFHHDGYTVTVWEKVRS
jgi:SAM-dependent methyltransferase